MMKQRNPALKPPPPGIELSKVIKSLEKMQKFIVKSDDNSPESHQIDMQFDIVIDLLGAAER